MMFFLFKFRSLKVLIIIRRVKVEFNLFEILIIVFLDFVCFSFFVKFEVCILKIFL